MPSKNTKRKADEVAAEVMKLVKEQRGHPNEEAKKPPVGGPSMGQVLGWLNAVLAGEMEYDEALEQLKMYAAQMRKGYPALHKVLNKGALEFEPITLSPAEEAMLAEFKAFEERLHNQMSTLLAMPVTARQTQPQAPQPVAAGSNGHSEPPAPEQDLPFDLDGNGMRVYGYRAWVKAEMKTAMPTTQWKVRWDLPSVPMPSIGSPLTLPIDGGRLRFNVLDVEGDVMLLECLTMLPPVQRGG